VHRYAQVLRRGAPGAQHARPGALRQVQGACPDALDDARTAGWSTKPIKAADFKGLKIRTWNREQVATLTKLGASSASITTAEVTPALQRGIVDGAFTASINAAAWNWSQVLKNGYMMNITLAHEVISVNAAALDELPPDLRKTFLEVSAAWEGKVPPTSSSSTRKRARRWSNRA
jgi:TRAP-type C4-dicarboxylate transport system substrate-binding protein